MHLHLEKGLTKKGVRIEKLFLYHLTTFIKISFECHLFPSNKFFLNSKFLEKIYFFNSFKKIYFVLPLLKGQISVFSFIVVCDTSTGNSHILKGVLFIKGDYFPIISMGIWPSIEVAKFIDHFRLTSYKIYKILRS